MRLAYKLAFVLFTGISSAVATAQALNGPLGLEMGLSKTQLTALIPDLKQVSPNRYTFHQAPKSYPGASIYFVDVGPTAGLCRMGAIIAIQSDGPGDEVKLKFVELNAALTESFGKPSKSLIGLKADSKWNKDEDWMMSLAQNDRTLASFWFNGKYGTDTLPADIQGITLEANGKTASFAAINVIYEFHNLDACINELG